MKHIIEKISALNLVCFILMSIGHIFNYPYLWHISAIGVILSLCASSYILYSSKKIKEHEVKKRQVVNSVKLLIFCIFFIAIYLLRFLHEF